MSLAVLLAVSCGKSKKDESTETYETQQPEQLQPLSKTVSLYSGEAITGDGAEYFAIDLPAGETIELKAEPAEDYSSPKYRVRVPLKIVKKFPGEISYLSLDVELLDENNEYVSSLSINSADEETLEAALSQGKTDVLDLGFATSVLNSDYEKKFNKVKSYRITDVSVSARSSSSATKTKINTSTDNSSSSSSSYSSSSYDDDDDEDYDDYDDDSYSTNESKLSKAKKAVNKTINKAKETYNEKYKDKVDDAKEKIKDKFNSLFD